MAAKRNSSRGWMLRLMAAWACCAAILLAMLLPATALAADAGSGSQDKVVKIGWFQSDLFQEGMSDDAQKSGYSYEYIHKIADYSGWTYEYVYGDWTELFGKLESGEIDLLAGVSITEERLDTILFPDDVMGYEHYVLYQHTGGDMDAADLSTFSGKKIGAITDNLMTAYLESWIADNQVDAQIVYYDSFEARDEDFADGKIDGLVTTNNGVLASSGYAQVVEVGEESYYLAVAKGRDDLLADLNRAQGYMEDIEPYFLDNLDYESYGTTLANSSLSSEEQGWLEQHGTLTVGYLDNYLPYCGTDADGRAYGLITDVMDAMLGELGISDRLTVAYRAYSSSGDMLNALKSGQIDAAFPVGGDTWTLEQEGIKATNAVVDAAEDLVYVGDYDEGKLARIAISTGNTMSENYAKSAFPDAQILYFDTITDCLDAVLAGEADSTLINGLRTDIVKDSRTYASLSIRQLEKTASRSIGVASDSTALELLLNRGLRLIGDNFGSNAAYSYMSDFYQTTIWDVLFDHMQLVVASIIALIVFIAAVAIHDRRRSARFLRAEEERNAQLQESVAKQEAQLAEIRALNSSLEEARSQAEAANNAKTAFLFNMSHDIRTPMNAIMGFRNLLEKYQDDPERRESYLRKIESSSNVLLSIINNVLEMARIEKGTMEVEEVAWGAEQFCDSMYSVFDVMMAQKDIAFTRQVEVEHPYVYCDPNKLRETFINILSNAYKYTEPGGSVSMRLEEVPCEREGWALYRTTISDTGIGMSEEFLPHLFEEFSREHTSTETKVEGTGLGMPIVKRLVEMLDGTIEVASKKGEGTTFTITIPHRIAEKPHVAAHEDIDFDPALFEGKRILLAEDNELNAEIAFEILGEVGFFVERAADGDVCVDMLRAADPGYYDLILMDIQMPRMNGYEATRAIRALDDPAKAGIKIIALTANAFEEDRQEALRAGMDGHAAKPINVHDLTATLASLL